MARLAATATTALLLLAACASPPEAPPLNVAELPAVRLSVQSVEVESRAPVPADVNFIERRRSEQLAADAQAYLRDRVQAVGGTEFARATVEEASLVERDRPDAGGLFSGQPDREMVGVLAVKVAVVDGLGIESAFASSRVQISRGLPARAGVEAEDAFARQLTNDLLAATSRELERSVEQNLGNYLVR